MSEWISVKDRLPEEDDMSCYVCDVELDKIPTVAWYQFVGMPPGFYTSDSRCRLLVTHWMKIPKLPGKK